jgi:hypothetical protein
MTIHRTYLTLLVPTLVFSLSGCGGEPSLPDLTEVEGVVLLGGQPLPHAKITFNPTKSGLPANSIGTAVTDEEGKFKLSTAGKPGAVPCEHVITVVEGPPPEDVRGQDGQDRMNRYRATLKNRPIPPKYGNVNQSDARVTVALDKKEYQIELNR